MQRKLEKQRQDLKNTESREEKRKFGELITANIYRLKKGMTELVTEDYYEEGCPEIRIPLDPLKTPQQNAAALFPAQYPGPGIQFTGRQDHRKGI